MKKKSIIAMWALSCMTFITPALAQNCPNFSGRFKVSNPEGCHFDQIIHCGIGKDDVMAISRLAIESRATVEVTQNGCESITLNSFEPLPFDPQAPLEEINFSENSFTNKASQSGTDSEDGVPTVGHESEQWSVTRNQDGSLELSASCTRYGLIAVIPVYDHFSGASPRLR